MNFESAFKLHFKKNFKLYDTASQKSLRKSLAYSLFSKASRFRPRLSFAVSEFLGKNPKQILPWAIAIEMVHCASLIHDDLPLMDDEKTRRGKKCNHLLFGEDIALLAGTCLFIESFALFKDPLFDKKRGEAMDLFISKIGYQGLISGQALDLRENLSKPSSFLKMIQLKTGSLISAGVEGPLLLWGKKPEEIKALKKFSKELGQAYQLADDLKDKDNSSQKREELIKNFNRATTKSQQSLKAFGKRTEKLMSFIPSSYL